MTETIITRATDTWVNSAKSTATYGDTNAVHVKSGERRGLVRPPLPNILGMTVTSATLYGHAGGALVAQTFSLAPLVDHWTQGRATWANQPGVDTSAYVYATIGALVAGETVAFDVTAHLQAVADGTLDYHGWRLGTDSTATSQRFRSTQSGEPAWELHLTIVEDASTPSGLRPDGGAVSTSEPILAWDVEGQVALRVQVDTPAAGVDPDEVTPDYDSGWQTSTSPEWDLAAATYTPPASPPGETYWRVQIRDADANESDWSDWADFTVTALPTLVIDAPTGAIGDPSVTVLAHLSSGTLASWEVWATGPDRADVRWESGEQTGPISAQIPAKNSKKRKVLKESENGWIYVRATDDVERTVAVGELPYLETWIPVTWTTDGTAVAPTNLQVVQSAEGDPRLTWRWRSTDAADAWLLKVDGDTVVRVLAEDVSVSAGTYSYTDRGEVPPGRPRTLSVAAALPDDQASDPATFTYHVHHVSAVWLIPDDEEIAPIRLAGKTGPEATRSDRVGTYVPVSGPEIDVVYDWEGVKGTFRGGVSAETDVDPTEVWNALDRIQALQESKVRTSRMVWGSKSITVLVRHLGGVPHGTYTPQNLRHAVGFEFAQVGD